MSLLRPLFATLLALAPLAPGAAAQGLVQLRLEGALSDRGARVELEVGALVQGRPRQLDLHVFVGPGTTGAELVALCARRLVAEGFVAIAPDSGAAESAGRSLFVEQALFVRARLGGGLAATITCCEGPPAAVRILRPGPGAEEARLLVSAGTYSPHTHDVGTAELALRLAATDASPQIAARMLEASQAAQWMTDRPGGDAWRPMKMMDGALFTGLSVSLVSRSDWRLEVELPRSE